MIPQTALAWAPASPGWSDGAVRSGVRRAADPAGVADDDRPAVPDRLLPWAAGRDQPAVSHGRVSRSPAEDHRVAADREQQRRRRAWSAARSSPTSRYSAGEWSLPPIGPRPSSDGHAHPGGRVRVGRAAGRGVLDLEPEPLASATGVIDQPARPLELLHRPPAGHVGSISAVVSGTARAVSRSPIAASAASRSSRRTARTSTSSSQRSATTLGRVPPPIDADVDRDARPAAVERVELADESVRGLEDRAAALLGLDAGVGRAAVDRDPRVEDALARRDDVAVRAGALEDEADVGVGGQLADVRRRRRRADLLVGVRDERQPFERQRRRPRRRERPSAYRPASRPALHVGDAGAVRDAVGRSRTAARPRCPGRTPCPCGRSAATRGPVGRARGTSPTTVAPSRPLGSGRTSTSAPMLRRNAGDQPPDLVDAGLGVAAAVDVDEALEVGEVGGHRRRGWRRRARSSSASLTLGSGRGQVHRRAVYGAEPTLAYPRRTVRLVEIRLLEGPNVYRLEPVVKVEVAIGRRRTWYGQREPGRHALVRLGGDGPAEATGRTRSDGSSPGSGACASTSGEGRGGVAVHRSSDPGHWIVDVPVDRRGAGATRSPRPRSP